MKVALYQMDSQWEQPAQNMRKAEAWISAVDADLVVLPEMFSTGFTMTPEKAAETMDSQTVKWLTATAKREAKAITCSVAIKEDGCYYNRLFFVFPDGSYRTYDKHHLFRMGGEDKVYTAGDERVIVEFMGYRIMPLVCYDLRFPVWSRCREDYDVLLYVASWPAVRSFAWESLLVARAIENRCYTIGLNRTGSDPFNAYSGNSAILDFMGRSIADVNGDTLTATLERAPLDEFRAKFPAHLDADDFVIK